MIRLTQSERLALHRSLWPCLPGSHSLEEVSVRLGGQFYIPGEESGAKRVGRLIFLRAVAHVRPDVLRTLEEHVYPVFEQYPPFTDADLEWEDSVGALQAWRAARSEGGSTMAHLIGALSGWQTSWNLSEEWVAEEAILALWRWYGSANSDLVPGLTLAHCWSSAWQPDDRESDAPYVPYYPFFPFPSWPVLWETRQEYEVRAKAEFEKTLRLYVDDVERRAERQGLERTPEVRARLGLPVDRHFEWLARYQCGVSRQYEIADEAGVSESKVSRAINEAARLIGLTLYNGKKGSRRPGKRK